MFMKRTIALILLPIYLDTIIGIIRSSLDVDL